jgi:hypothetical protein
LRQIGSNFCRLIVQIGTRNRLLRFARRENLTVDQFARRNGRGLDLYEIGTSMTAVKFICGILFEVFIADSFHIWRKLAVVVAWNARWNRCGGLRLEVIWGDLPFGEIANESGRIKAHNAEPEAQVSQSPYPLTPHEQNRFEPRD